MMRMPVTPLYISLSTSWRNATVWRRALWLGAIGLCLLHLAGIGAWIAFTPSFAATLTDGPPDLVVYYRAGQALRDGTPLYWLDRWPSVMAYYYHPAFALLYSWLAMLPFRALALLMLLVQVSAYTASWYVWRRVLLDLQLKVSAASVVAWFPAGILYTQWYAHTFYGNPTGLLCLLSALLTWAIIRERAHLAALAALPIVLLKPHWLFPLILLIAFRRWRLAARLGGWLLGAYIIVNALYVALVGPHYGIASLRDYCLFLSRIDANFPWDAPGPLYPSMNHSWQQLLIHYGVPFVSIGVLLFKLALVGALVGAVVLAWRRHCTIAGDGAVALLLMWLGYLTAMAMLGQLWGLDAGMLAFVFLWSVAGCAARRWLLAFLAYAFWEVWLLIDVARGGDGLWLPQHVPTVLIALLLLYAVGIVTVYGRLLRRPATS